MASPLPLGSGRATTRAPAAAACLEVASLEPSSTTTSSSTRPGPSTSSSRMTRTTSPTVASSSRAGMQTETRWLPLALASPGASKSRQSYFATTTPACHLGGRSGRAPTQAPAWRPGGQGPYYGESHHPERPRDGPDDAAATSTTGSPRPVHGANARDDEEGPCQPLGHSYKAFVAVNAGVAILPRRSMSASGALGRWRWPTTTKPSLFPCRGTK